MMPSFELPVNATQETHDLALYVEGFAKGAQDEKLAKAAKWLDKLSRQVCGQGYIGCRGGERCTSDHK